MYARQHLRHIRAAQTQLAMGRSLRHIQGHRAWIVPTTGTLRRRNTKLLEYRAFVSLLPIADCKTCTQVFTHSLLNNKSSSANTLPSLAIQKPLELYSST